MSEFIDDHTQLNVHDLIHWNDPSNKRELRHTWRVLSIALGALGTESVIHVENVSHKPAWTGEWETHVAMYIPECLLRTCLIERPAADTCHDTGGTE